MTEQVEEVAAPTPSTPASEGHIAVIVPIGERWDDLAELYGDMSRPVAQRFRHWEFIFVLDGPNAKVRAALAELAAREENCRVVETHRHFGEATAMNAALSFTDAETVLLLSPYYQVEPDGVGTVLDAFLDRRADMVSGRRDPRVDAPEQQFQTRMFHRLITRISGVQFKDIACGCKVTRREVLEQLNSYGDQYRFLPLLAVQRGFSVREVAVPQSPKDVRPIVYAPGTYVRRALDLASVVFLFKFTEKPLRFFGLVGLGLAGVGGIIMAWLAVWRLAGGGALADRPLLVLGTLLFVLGAQAIAIGLLGELLIFSQTRSQEHPLVEEVRAPDD